MKDSKWIEGFKGRYKVSASGDVYSYNTGTAYKLYPEITRNGYARVTLYKDKVPVKRLIHRLVAEAFIPNTDNKPQVNHLNEDKLDNRCENLEWVTSEENVNYGNRSQKVACRLSKAVEAYDSEGVKILEFSSMMDAKRAGFSNGNISMCCRKIRKRYKGYYWKFKEEE
ncbi:DNA endonuclease [Enterococcus phage EG103P3]|nr:DNA endonuclease [Enterococcus phage EG103P3]